MIKGQQKEEVKKDELPSNVMLSGNLGFDPEPFVKKPDIYKGSMFFNSMKREDGLKVSQKFYLRFDKTLYDKCKSFLTKGAWVKVIGWLYLDPWVSDKEREQGIDKSFVIKVRKFEKLEGKRKDFADQKPFKPQMQKQTYNKALNQNYDPSILNNEFMNEDKKRKPEQTPASNNTEPLF